MATLDHGVLRVSQLLKEAAKCSEGWHERVRAALSALLVFFDEEPGWARLLLGGSPLGEREQFEGRDQALHALAQALEAEVLLEANHATWFVPWPRLTAELVVGGVVAVIRNRALEAERKPFVELAPSLMAFIMAHYPGSNANLNPVSTVPADDPDQPQRLPVRVTYRTTRVLAAIGDSPGLSNRDIAEAAGLSDEGQTSRLLRRLEERNLLQNLGVGQAYGGANAWLLTFYGERVLNATRRSLVPGAGAVTGRRARGEA